MHELGHFIQLNHTTNPTDLMYWTANNGPLSPSNRLTLASTSAQGAVAGGKYSVNQSIVVPGGCLSFPSMSPSTMPCRDELGVTPVTNNTIFTIYPNPSNGTFIMESGISDYTLIITNILGQRLFSKRIEEKKTEISLSAVANGMYFVQEQYKNGMATQKIVITK